MEKNTFATSTYIAVDTDTTFDYLTDLSNLGKWTHGNKLQKKVDENTWIGSSTGSQKSLYYQVHKITELPFPCFEWRIGTELNQYHSYPVFLFPVNYIEPENEDIGTYFHWLSFVSPKQRTPLVTDGFINITHDSECRALKAVLETTQGLRAPASGRYSIETSSIYIDAPFEFLVQYLSDLTNMEDWCHLKCLLENISSNQCSFLDEYLRPLKTQTQTYRFSNSALIEYNSVYIGTEQRIKTPILVVPCTHAFGENKANGCILHRMTFVPKNTTDSVLHSYQNLAADNINIKRLVETLAGNLDSLTKGMSYIEAKKNNFYSESRTSQYSN